MAGELSLENPVFSMFAFYAAILVLKCLMMSLLTGRHRIGKKVFANEEDCAMTPKKDLKPNFGDADVERVRRAHLNDLENIVPFLILGFLYVFTNPDPFHAALHFRIFTAARILHTITYLNAIPQPSRGLCFFVGMIINVALAVRIVMAAQY